MNRLFQQVCSAATEIIERKSYTNTAIGTAIIRPVKVLLEDQKSVSTVSRMLTGKYGLKDVCLSVPSVVGIAGVEDALLQRLDAAELKGLQRSAAFLKDNISGLNFY
jgi:L-lactate dehydrogenase